MSDFDTDTVAANQAIGLLEILDRGGRVRQRLRLDGTALRIGRSYDCDLILDDPFVSPVHAEVELIGQTLSIRDLASDNGLFVRDSTQSVAQATLNPGGGFRIGHTDIRFVTPDLAVAPARRDVRDRGRLQLLTNRWVQLGLLFLALIALGSETYFNFDRKVDWAELAGEVAGSSIMLIAWAMFWALLNRLLNHRLNFMTHLAIASLGTVSWWLLALLGDYFTFAFTLDGSSGTISSLLTLAIAMLVVFFHLRFASHARLWRLAAVAGSIGAFGLFFSLMSALEQRDEFEFSWQELSIKSPRWLVGKPETPSAFLGNAQELADQLQEIIDEEALERAERGD